MSDSPAYWSLTKDEIFAILNSSQNGLSEEEAKRRLYMQPAAKKKPQIANNLALYFHQFRNPLVLLLLLALILSSILGEVVNALIIFCILFVSGTLGYIQEKRAGTAEEKLRRLVQVKATAIRGGKKVEIMTDRVVPGDLIVIDAGDVIPADCIVVQCEHLFVNQSILTGESFPSEKDCITVSINTPLTDRRNMVFKGTNVVSGTATVIAIEVGVQTEFGKTERGIESATNETAFDKVLKKFGLTLMRTALALAGVVLIFDLATGKAALDSVLFTLALSLALTPEILPAILTITLSTGARKLAHQKVIVKKLSSVQNLGAIDILCCDKTGTLTVGTVTVNSHLSVEGYESSTVEKYAFLNSVFESGYTNPIDVAIRAQSQVDITGYEKFDEVPFDFVRKRLSIVVAFEGRHIMITKGALDEVMEICNKAQLSDGQTVPIDSLKEKVNWQLEQYSKQAYRTIAIAIKDVTADPIINKDDENDMTFLGFITLNDPLKQGIASAINKLRHRNVALKIISGDNLPVATAIAIKHGIQAERIISGDEINHLDDNALAVKTEGIDVFAATMPSQKERIVKALQRNGHIVGYLGNGVNDAPALKPPMLAFLLIMRLTWQKKRRT